MASVSSLPRKESGGYVHSLVNVLIVLFAGGDRPGAGSVSVLCVESCVVCVVCIVLCVGLCVVVTEEIGSSLVSRSSRR